MYLPTYYTPTYYYSPTYTYIYTYTYLIDLAVVSQPVFNTPEADLACARATDQGRTRQRRDADASDVVARRCGPSGDRHEQCQLWLRSGRRLGLASHSRPMPMPCSGPRAIAAEFRYEHTCNSVNNNFGNNFAHWTSRAGTL